jgi:hypothetical protein
MYKSRLGTLVPYLLVLSAACGGDAAASEPTVSTGLPANEKLSSFDDNDAKAACEALNQGATRIITDEELLRAQCASRAIGATVTLNADKTEVKVDVTKCATLVKSCEEDPVSYGLEDGGERDEADCSDASANKQVMSCDATVAQYEACMSKLLGQAKQTLANITCDNGKALIESDGAETKLDPQQIAECKTFLDKCPDVKIVASVGD